MQNMVNPVRSHTPTASPPNPPDKDDDDDDDKGNPNDSDSESGEDTNKKNAPIAGGGNANHANSGNPGGDPDDSEDEPHDGESQGSSNIEEVDEVLSPSDQNLLASHLVRLSDKIDSINDEFSSRSIMQVKSIEMTLTKLDGFQGKPNTKSDFGGPSTD